MKTFMRLFKWNFFSLMCGFFPYSAYAVGAQIETPKVCLILDKAGKDDHGFNSLAVQAFDKARRSSQIDSASRIFEAKEDAQVAYAIRAFAASGCQGIIAIGINTAEGVKEMAPRFPRQNFTLIDAVVSAPNVRSIVFREDEGSFLMGTIAAMKSPTKTVGFIGGMDIPLIQKFESAYKAGVRYINPSMSILSAYVGVTVDAWNNPSKAQEIATSQFQRGAGIIFQASGGSGFGVFDAVEKRNTGSRDNPKAFVIGVDANQNWIKPGLILTSMIKDIDRAVADTIQLIHSGGFQGGIVTYGLENGGIDWALDKYNSHLFTKDEVKKIQAIIVSISRGQIKVSATTKAQEK